MSDHFCLFVLYLFWTFLGIQIFLWKTKCYAWMYTKPKSKMSPTFHYHSNFVTVFVTLAFLSAAKFRDSLQCGPSKVTTVQLCIRAINIPLCGNLWRTGEANTAAGFDAPRRLRQRPVVFTSDGIVERTLILHECHVLFMVPSNGIMYRCTSDIING